MADRAPDAEHILKERGSTYGGDHNLHMTARAWDAYVRGMNGRVMTAQDVCHMMMILKSLRVACGGIGHQDNHDDAEGYARLAARINRGEPR